MYSGNAPPFQGGVTGSIPVSRSKLRSLLSVKSFAWQAINIIGYIVIRIVSEVCPAKLAYGGRNCAPVAQWIERIASDDEVGGSNPLRGTI